MSSPARRGRKAKREAPEEGVVGEAEEEVKKVERAVARAAKKVEKIVEGKPEKKHEGPPKPSGRVPEAMVMARHGTGMIGRPGRGFSLGELSGVGLSPDLASRWGARIDTRRRSVLDGNVNSLKAWHGGARAVVEREAKVVEEELKEVGEEVEREVAAVEKEVAKAGSAIKKEAKKAEKAVAQRVKKPRARPKKKTKS